MKIIEKEYKEWKIYFSLNDINSENLGISILENNFKILNVLKDTKRNYVAIVEINNKKYILKEFRSEVIIPQRKIQTFFKKGEAITTLENCIEAIEDGIDELVKPLVALVKKKKLIEKSFLLMEYIEGNILRTKEDIDEVLKITKKIHHLNRYHGDLNTSNFIKTKTGIKIIDTQMKKEKNIYFKRNYDIFTLKEDLLVLELEYNIDNEYNDIKKDMGYYLAKGIKSFKKLKIVNQIKRKKKEMRKKGWKI